MLNIKVFMIDVLDKVAYSQSDLSNLYTKAK